MRHFIAGWFHGNLTRAHWVTLAVIIGIIAFAVIDAGQSDRAMDDFIKTYGTGP